MPNGYKLSELPAATGFAPDQLLLVSAPDGATYNSKKLTGQLLRDYLDTVYARTSSLGAYLPLAGGTLTGTLTARRVDVQAGYALTVGGGPELGILSGPYPALWLSDLAHTQYTYALAYDPGTDDLFINTPAMGNIRFRISNVDQISIDVAGKLWAKSIDIAAGAGLTVDTNALIVTPTTKTVTMAGSLAVATNVLVANLAGYTGKVGIGTATPASALDVYGTISVDGIATVDRYGTSGLLVGKATNTVPSGSYSTWVGDDAGNRNIAAYAVGVGYQAGYQGSAVGGNYSCYFGERAGLGATNTYGIFIGSQAGWQNTGQDIVCIGRQAGYHDSPGGGNSSFWIGPGTGSKNTGASCVGIGAGALYQKVATNAFNSVGIGYYAGGYNTATRLTAIGYNAAQQPAATPGASADGVAIGYSSCNYNTSSYQTACGAYAGHRTSQGGGGDKSCYYGWQSGYDNTTANVTAVGYQAGYQASAGGGAECTFAGYYAGRLATCSYTVAAGGSAGVSNSGSYNVFVGQTAGGSSGAATNNCGIGASALEKNTSSYTTGFGTQAGYQQVAGGNNYGVFLGNESGKNNTAANVTSAGAWAGKQESAGGGANSCHFGYYAGYTNTAANQINLGYKAGYGVTTASRMYIGYDAPVTNSAILYGELPNSLLRINASTINLRFADKDATEQKTVVNIANSVATSEVGFFGATAVVKQSTTGTVTGFTQGSGNAVNDVSTFTGNSGSTAYTVGDLVLALKNYGLLAA